MLSGFRWPGQTVMGSWPPATINTMTKPRTRNEGSSGTSFSSVEMFHTHAPQQRGFWGSDRWDESEGEREMEMRWRWEWDDKLLNRDTRRGTQKRKGKRENTNTNTPSPERANPERGKEKKKRTDDGPTTKQIRGGRTKRLTQPKRREPNLPRPAKDPNLT